ncbi:prenyltransferase/squalene oxidase repeat-containing protein [Streptomyces sp. NPDC020965]|uniref:prenyltransferase/squalene oxidase repeat-containing protein n=1 Tax=Streptomyces sp. NPDC020965 TaxID=3365105 RepID=UPI0037998849
MALVLAVFLTVGAGVALVTGTPVAADPVEKCTATKGALVVVDFGPFGGTIEKGCDTTPGTGFELLEEGGFDTTGTEHDGPGFICRIGHGAFNSGTPYPTPEKEDCVLTPQATAYWSYWIASPGDEKWTYSPLGAMERQPKAGDVDAWVFGGTSVTGSTGRPTFTPADVRPGGDGSPDPGDPPTPPPGEVAVPVAARWVTSRLTDGERVVDEGAETPNHLLTTEAAYALAAADGKSKTLDKVTDFAAASATAYAYPTGKDAAPDPNAAARLALLATITERDPRAFGGHDLLGDLRKNVCTTAPGPGCTAKGDFLNAGYGDAQALAVLALLRGGVTPPADSVTRLTGLQCQDGGFTSILIGPDEHCEADPATTGLITLVLKKAGGHDAAVARARTYLKKVQLRDGSFLGSAHATVSSVMATAFGSQALRALGDRAHADAAVFWLSHQQLEGGGFGFEEGATDPALYATSPAVLAAQDTSLVTLTTKKPNPKPTHPPTKPTDPPTGPPGDGPDLRKGVTFLTRQDRLVQGHYYGAGGGTGRADYGLTIDGAYALAATGLDNNALRGIVDFLDGGGQDASGRTLHHWTGVGTKHAGGGSMGKAALLAQAVGRDPRAFGGQDLIAGIGKAVCRAPSKAPDRSCAATGAYTYAPSVFAHSLAVIAQVRAGEKTAATGPVNYLKSLQHTKSDQQKKEAGAWPSLVPPTGDSDVDSTAMAAMTLDFAAGAESAGAVDKALAWIASKQLPDGGFPGASGNSVNSAALAVQSLSLDSVKYRAQIVKARKFLASQQNADGGFNVTKGGQPGSDVRASTQAIGGSTGISFALLTRDLKGTTPQPPGPGPVTPPPVIVTPGDPSGGIVGNPGTAGTAGTGGTAGSADGGRLASTGVQVGALAAAAAVLGLAGWGTVVVARNRRAGIGGTR